MEDMYKVKVKCENCGFSGESDIPKGTSVEDHKCSSCGLTELTRETPFAIG